MTMGRSYQRLLLTSAILLTAMLLTALAPTVLLAQTDSREDKLQDLPIGLTEEEKTRLHEIGMYQTATPPPPAPIRKPAEWEPVTGVLVRYNYGFGLPYAVLREFAEDIQLHVLCITSQQTSCWNNLESNGVNMANVELINLSTNSIWTRDYGPQIHFSDGIWSITDLVYNRPRPLDDQVPWGLGTYWGCSVYGTDLVHTGGNFMADGHGIGFSTDMVWDENPGLTHAQIAQEMESYLGISNYVVVPDINPSGIHHIDVWAKLLDEETILVQEVAPTHAYYDSLEAKVAQLQTLTNCYGRPYKIVRVYSGSIGGGDVAGYTNSLILNDKVFVPLFGISSDAAALATYEAAMPGYQVLGYTGSWLEDDAIHCRGMEIHDRYMLVVDTNPLQDKESNDGDYRVTAFIDDRSEAGLVTDSLLVYWRLEGSPTYNAVVMQATADPDSYYADIPQQSDLVNIEYYVFAKDNAGRREARPMVAPNAWYTFNTGETQTTCSVQPTNFDFGTVPIGSYVDTTFTITNTGTDTLSCDVSESCDHYSILSGGGAHDIPPGEYVTVTVRFEPTAAGTHVCTIETGQEICSDVACTGVGELPPACLVDPVSLNFGIVAVGAYKDTTFSITNTGGGTLSGDVSEACSEYSIVSGSGPYDLTAAQSVTVTVRFEPTSAGTHLCTIETGQALCSDVACTGVGEEPPVCLVVPTSLDFGTIPVFTVKDTTFSISNIGGGTLSGDVSEACDDYSILSGGGPYDLTTGESVTVTVRFEPTGIGTVTTYDFQTGGGIDKWFYATGDCGSQPPATPPNGSEVTTYSEIAQSDDNRYGTSYSRRDYPTHEFRFDIDEAEGSITQLDVEWEGYATDINGSLWLYIWDSDASSWVEVDATTQEAGDDVLAGTFTSNIARFIDAGGDLWLAANCNATTSVGGGGTFYTDKVEVVVACGPGETRTCTIETGQAICSDVACTGVAADVPACVVSPENLDFGTVTVGAYNDLTFSITNVGGGTLSGSVSEACAEYSIVSGGGAYALTNGQSVVVTVRFEPTAEGTHLCTIETGTDCADVSCTGVGELPPACAVVPTSLDFGTVTIGEYADLTFTITNTGGGTLTGDVTETCNHYAITGGGGAYSLGAAEFITVTVRFEPTAEGTHLCTIETGTDCADVSCTGVGLDVSGITDDKEQAIPGSFRLAQNSPNPFSSVTAIRYELPVDCHVTLEIYSVLGEKVATLVDEHQAAGYRVAHWDSRTGNGSDLAAGIYLCRLQSEGYVEIRKMVLHK